jgi:NADPH2:quinone reductase
MKAVLSTQTGGPDTLVVEDVAAPSIGAGQVRLVVKACGVNYPDVLLIQDLYQYKPPRPFAPGGEVSGIIESVGEAVQRLRPGDRVLATCGWGGMAQQVVVDESKCWQIPASMPFDEAAALLVTYGTSHYALQDRGGLKAGETLLVLGAAGGVGLAAVELGKAAGARVVAAASSQAKVDVALKRGADYGLVYPLGPFDKASSKVARRAIQISLRRTRRERDLRHSGWGLCRAGAARQRLGRPLSGRWISSGYSKNSVESATAEILPDRGRRLGCVDRARSARTCTKRG